MARCWAARYSIGSTTSASTSAHCAWPTSRPCCRRPMHCRQCSRCWRTTLSLELAWTCNSCSQAKTFRLPACPLWPPRLDTTGWAAAQARAMRTAAAFRAHPTTPLTERKHHGRDQPRHPVRQAQWLSYKAVDSALVFCKLRGNPYVELEHWVAQIVQNPDSDCTASSSTTRSMSACWRKHHRRARPAAAWLATWISESVRQHRRQRRARLGLRLR